MPDFKQYKKTTLDELTEKENQIHDNQKKKSELNKASKMPMPVNPKKEAKEPTYLMLKHKKKLRSLAEESGMSMAELVDFWIDNAEL